MSDKDRWTYSIFFYSQSEALQTELLLNVPESTTLLLLLLDSSSSSSSSALSLWSSRLHVAVESFSRTTSLLITWFNLRPMALDTKTYISAKYWRPCFKNMNNFDYWSDWKESLIAETIDPPEKRRLTLLDLFELQKRLKSERFWLSNLFLNLN